MDGPEEVLGHSLAFRESTAVFLALMHVSAVRGHGLQVVGLPAPSRLGFLLHSCVVGLLKAVMLRVKKGHFILVDLDDIH